MCSDVIGPIDHWSFDDAAVFAEWFSLTVALLWTHNVGLFHVEMITGSERTAANDVM